MSYEEEREDFRGKPPPRMWDKERLTVFSDFRHYSAEIRSMALALTREEALSYYNLIEEELPPYDWWFFDIEFNRGRLVAKQRAAHALTQIMEGGDRQAVMEYLSRFGGGEWTTKPNYAPDSTTEFRVVLDESR